MYRSVSLRATTEFSGSPVTEESAGGGAQGESWFFGSGANATSRFRAAPRRVKKSLQV